MSKVELLKMMRKVVPDRTVYVLGAGFSRAFAPNAPLVEGPYTGPELDELANAPTAYYAVLREMQRRGRNHVNLERLMTRLDGGTPFDPEDAPLELRAVLSKLKLAMKVELHQVAHEVAHPTELAGFADHCLQDRVTIITFNYDLLLDRALYKASQEGGEAGSAHWCLDSGYGFRCASAFDRRCETCRGGPSGAVVLKLHGSINWFTRSGYSPPFPLDAVVHSEEWGLQGDDADRIGYVHEHLAPEPFIVPPVLTKSELMREPVLRLVWRKAYEALWTAQHVVFVGYSMPLTDMAAKFLFWEALDRVGFEDEPGRPGQTVRVVGLGQDAAARERLMAAYRDVFKGLPDEWFRFDGAVKWAKDVSEAGDPACVSPTSTA